MKTNIKTNKSNKSKVIIIILLMILSVLIYFSVKGYFQKLNPLKATSTETEQQKILRQAELQQQHETHNPQIVLNTLQKDKELLVLTGTISYNDAYEEQHWYSSKRLDVNLKYNYGISYSTEFIKAEYEGDDLVIKLNASCLNVKYVELADSDMTTTKSLLASQYKPSEVSSILKISKDDVTNFIIHNPKVGENAYNGLVEMITSLLEPLNLNCKNFEFRNVSFVME